jgi:2Fe-2S ferredoxin
MVVNVSLPNGQVMSVESKAGQSVMAALRDGGVPIRAECGGAMACATCHIHILQEWLDRVGPPGDEEADLLDDSDYATAASRLACQIDCVAPLDGLNVALQLDALED